MSSSYQALPHDEYSEKIGKSSWFTNRSSPICQYILGTYSVLITLTVFYVFLGDLFFTSGLNAECQQPTFRREWRTLNDQEKRSYIQAVKCLRDTPSRVGTNYSLYEDFAYVHALGSGIRTHGTGQFLTWHRYFLYIYEQALRDDCGYGGDLPYWDWRMDLQHIVSAPVWGAGQLAFGTNGTGEASAYPGVLRGSCVMDGPFANMTLHFLGQATQEHCFSRGFATGDLLHNLTLWLRPRIIEKLLLMPRYEDFNNYLEHYTHLAIPGIIQGDLVTFTSPNDPILFLHHAQLDRLWWLWQHFAPGRIDDYGGPLRRKIPSSEASVDIRDTLHMNGLAPDIPVAEIMNSRKGLLCYAYN